MNLTRWNGTIVLAATMLATAGVPAAYAGQNNTATVAGTNLPTGITARGMAAVTRTSDAGADYVNCEVQGNNSSCTASNENSFVPKNIGNVACIPKNFNSPVLTQQCQSLVQAGQGNCQTNSAAGSCNPKLEWEVKAACNYRTDNSSKVSANWTWTLNGATTTNGAFSLDCSQQGYQGYTQD
jgi:hypothetical protein